MTASVTNPFLVVIPRTPMKRAFQTTGDVEVCALAASKLAELTGDRRFLDYWKFVREGRTDVHLQRILDHSTNTKGFRFLDLEAKAKQGVPALLNSRTTPKAVGYDQVADSMPWYTKTGRLAFYREEPEFIAAGENLPVHREPVDSTFYEPNIIIARKHEALRPDQPEAYGVRRDDLSCETRCGRNVALLWQEAKKTRHPLTGQGCRFIFHTPKYRHGSHTAPIDTDMIAVLFGPFGDLYRHDKRCHRGSSPIFPSRKWGRKAAPCRSLPGAPTGRRGSTDAATPSGTCIQTPPSIIIPSRRNRSSPARRRGRKWNGSIRPRRPRATGARGRGRRLWNP